MTCQQNKDVKKCKETIEIGDIVTVMWEYPLGYVWYAEDENAKENPIRGEVTSIHPGKITISQPIMALPKCITVKSSKVVQHWKKVR